MHHPTDRITHTTALVTPVVEHWLEREIAQWLSKADIHLVWDMSDVGADVFLYWAGCSTSRPFYCQIDHLHEHFPHDWLRTLKNGDHYDGEKAAIFRIDLIGTKMTTDVKTKDIIICSVVTYNSKRRIVSDMVLYHMSDAI